MGRGNELPASLIEDKLGFRNIEWRGDCLRLLDQRLLPHQVTYVECGVADDVAWAIREMVVRGAPAIGIAAAYGMVLAALAGEDLRKAAYVLKAARPTAVNLERAVDHLLQMANASTAVADLEAGAIAWHRRDAEMCRLIGQNGAKLLRHQTNVLTHCNAGALATGGIGTALGIIYTAFFNGHAVHVWVDETRPLLQGARLTAWELRRAGVPNTIICDSAAASLMAAGKVDCVIVGADTIAANGDFANKVGTYGLAVLCHHHQLPFYVAAPSSSFDNGCASGADIVIEQRAAGEIRRFGDCQVTQQEADVYNPAFDVTPGEIVTAFIDEVGIRRCIGGQWVELTAE